MSCKYLEKHIKLTEMQVKILREIKDAYPEFDGVETAGLLTILVEKYGLNKRAWQGSLKGLGMKGYVTYGNGRYSCDGGVIVLDVAIDYYKNY